MVHEQKMFLFFTIGKNAVRAELILESTIYLKEEEIHAVNAKLTSKSQNRTSGKKLFFFLIKTTNHSNWKKSCNQRLKNEEKMFLFFIIYYARSCDSRIAADSTLEIQHRADDVEWT